MPSDLLLLLFFWFLNFLIFFSDFEDKVSPVCIAHYSQYKLITLLLKKLESLGFELCTLDEHHELNHCMLQEKRILMGAECTSIKPAVEGVKVGIFLLMEGKVKEMNFRCSFVIGSDGARSTVRKLVGIKMQGERDLQKLVSVHFLSKDLGQYLLHKRPGMLFFIFNPEAIGVLVAHDLDEGEFVLQVIYLTKVSDAIYLFKFIVNEFGVMNLI